METCRHCGTELEYVDRDWFHAAEAPVGTPCYEGELPPEPQDRRFKVELIVDWTPDGEPPPTDWVWGQLDLGVNVVDQKIEEV